MEANNHDRLKAGRIPGAGVSLLVLRPRAIRVLIRAVVLVREIPVEGEVGVPVVMGHRAEGLELAVKASRGVIERKAKVGDGLFGNV